MADLTPEQIIQNMADLDFTQDFRKRIVSKIGSKAIEDSNAEMLDKTMKALDGMDKVSLGRLKLDSKAKENTSRAEESEALAAMLVALADRRSTQEVFPESHNSTREVKLPTDKRPDYDRSQNSITSSTESYNEFISRVEKQ